MASATLSTTRSTLNRRDEPILTINTDISTVGTRVTAQYELAPAGALNADEYQTGAGGGVKVGLLDRLRFYVKRKLPSVAGGVSAEDTTAMLTASVIVKQIETDTTTCATTVAGIVLVGTVSMIDSELRASRVIKPVPTPLTQRGELCTLPKMDIPTSLYLFSDSASNFGPYNALAGVVTEIGLSYSYAVADVIEITGPGNSFYYKNVFSDCVNFVALAKERDGGFVNVAFNRMQQQAGLVAANVESFPPAAYANPVTEGQLGGRVIELYRQGIKGTERQTFTAFLAGTAFWLWSNEQQEYLPAQLTSSSPMDYKTSEIRVTLTLSTND